MSTVATRAASSAGVANSLFTSIGRKILMAVTGAGFIGFVCGHLLGNLQIFLGQDRLNTYAETLHHLGGLLWIVRGVLILFFLVHIWFGITLWLANRRARPVRYAHEDTVQASFSSRTMIYTGLALLGYVVYHLLHFTLVVTNPEYADLKDSLGRTDVYSMVITGFRNPVISAVYIVAMIGLAFHVNHALGSLFQTLGLNNDTWRPRLDRLANVFAIIVTLGYISMPVAVLAGALVLPGGGC